MQDQEKPREALTDQSVMLPPVAFCFLVWHGRTVTKFGLLEVEP